MSDPTGHAVTITACWCNDGTASLVIMCECGWYAPDEVAPFNSGESDEAEFDALAEAVAKHRAAP